MNFLNHERASQWCHFPRGKCTCRRDKIQYTRLHSRLEEGWGEDDPDSEEMVFYYEDGTSFTIVVDKDLCALDLCQFLAIKKGMEKSVHWSIVEWWEITGIERWLEDHEYVLLVFRDTRLFAAHAEFKYCLKMNDKKYDLFMDPLHYFPSGMLDFESETDGNLNPTYLKNLIFIEGECPIIFSYVWVRNEKNKMWAKMYIVLRDKKLFTCQTISSLARIFRSPKNMAIQMISEDKIIAKDVSLIASLEGYQICTPVNAKHHQLAPTKWGITLRLSGNNTADKQDLCCLACDSERVRTCWISAMRLAKYGKQLRENYKTFRSKQAEEINSKDYNSYALPEVQLVRSHTLHGPIFKLGKYQEINRDRVPMDFTEAVGRVVTDPDEATSIVASESYSWKRKWLSPSRFSLRKSQDESSDSGVHLTQPWFHKGLTREQATALLNKNEKFDGLFLVRDSSSTRGSIVISYRSGNKVIHTPIVKVKDRLSKESVYTVNNGKVKFYDILQLIEFHQLNASELPIRLTHYILKNTTTIVPVLPSHKAVKDQEQPSTSGSQGSPTKGSPTKGSPTKASPTKASTSKDL